MVFIDGSNFYYHLRSSFSTTKIYFEKLCNYLSQDNDLIEIKYYNSPLNRIENPEKCKKQQRFFEYLFEVPLIDIYFGRLEKRPDRKKAKKALMWN